MLKYLLLLFLFFSGVRAYNFHQISKVSVNLSGKKDPLKKKITLSQFKKPLLGIILKHYARPLKIGTKLGTKLSLCLH